MKVRLRCSALALVAAAGLLPLPICAQLAVSAGTYSQNFDSLASSGTSNPWTDSSTLLGWYAMRSGTNTASYRAGDGSSNAGDLWSFGAAGVGSLTDRALGSVASGSATLIAFGVRFTNNTASTANVTVSVTAEQWRNGGNTNPQTLSFAYQVSNAPLTNATTGNWTSFPPLDFVTPTTGSMATALDGNAGTNRQVFTNVLLTGASVASGQEIFLRWTDNNDSGNDHGFGLDDLTVTFNAVPNPPAVSASALSILTYNVKGNGATNWSTNSLQVQAIARQLQYLQADVVTFNEIPIDYAYEMTNWVSTLLPAYKLAVSSGNDGSICSAIISRYPIARSNSWMARMDLRGFGYSNANNNLDNFTRDLFEAEIDVPGFPQPLHVFTTHLKATESGEYTENAAKRAAEATAITNFLATNMLAVYPLHPFILTGDMNESDTNALAIQKLINPTTGFTLTNPRNPVTGSINTYSTTTANPSSRLDYLFPGQLLFSNIRTSQVFRTDRLAPVPPNLNSNDCKIASDHLPVLIVFNNPYDKPFKLLSITRTNPTVTLQWESVPGQMYRVEASSNLTSWSTLANNLLAAGTNHIYSTNLGEAIGYFRVRQSP